MPLSFPSSPTVGQIYTSGIYSWRWDGERWTPMLVQGASGSTGATGATGPAGSNGTIGVDGATGATGPAGTGATGATGATGIAAQFFTGNTAPASPQPGDHWLDTVNMIELIYYADGDSAQWVEITGRASSATTRNLSNLANTAINTSLVPNANLAYDLGTSSLRWRDLYLSGNTIDIGGTAIKSSANGISFTNAANAQATVPLTVSSIQLSTGGNTITLQAGASGLQAVGSSGNAVPIMGGGGGGNFTYGNTAPTSPAAGDRWLDSETLKEFVFANLGSTGIWIEPAGDGAMVGATGPAGAAGAAGPQGATGIQGATGLGFTWRGTWSNLASYYINDVVSFGGASYVALTLHTNSQPPSANWAVVASQGATGTAGAQGATGVTGATGAPGAAGSAAAIYDVSTTSTGFFDIPVGTTAQRGTGQNGALRMNSDTNYIEFYYNGVWNSIVPVGYLQATGGTVTYDGNFKIHTFTTSGSFIVNNITPTSNQVDYLIVGGGGGSGQGNGNEGGGGGGAGGLVEGTATVTATTYSITVGAGGNSSADVNSNGSNGSTSSAFGFTAAGGGGGGGCSTSAGANGGSAGGGSGCGSDKPGGTATQVSTYGYGYGNNGGAGAWSGNGPGSGGGGGGAGSAGVSGRTRGSSTGGGGTGRSSSISGTALEYAVGGGGAAGLSVVVNGVSGTNGRGNGAQGANNGANSTKGGDGVVIIRYRYQ